MTHHQSTFNVNQKSQNLAIIKVKEFVIFDTPSIGVQKESEDSKFQGNKNKEVMHCRNIINQWSVGESEVSFLKCH